MAICVELKPNFNPLFPRGKRQLLEFKVREDLKFQSTLPSREETFLFLAQNNNCSISIHSSLAGRDYYSSIFIHLNNRFQSTLPSREETSNIYLAIYFVCIFQSTLPSREETSYLSAILNVKTISIHSSLAGRDPAIAACLNPLSHFNPLFPRGKRLCFSSCSCLISNFNPLFPRGKRHSQA